VEPLKFQSAGFAARGAASILDGLVVGVVSLAFFGILFKEKENSEALTGFAMLLYYIFATYLYGTTLGKRFFGIAVKDKSDKKLSFFQVILRESVGKLLSAVPFYLGYFWAIWDKDKQAWHDKIAGTYVVQVEFISKVKKALAYFLVFLLPTIAIIGIIATVVLIAINPIGQLRKAQELQRLEKLQQDKTENVQLQ